MHNTLQLNTMEENITVIKTTMGVLAKDNSQFLSYLTLNNRDVERSLQVIQTATIRKLGCGFLCAFHGRIFNRL